jgi:hypothetical protein
MKKNLAGLTLVLTISFCEIQSGGEITPVTDAATQTLPTATLAPGIPAGSSLGGTYAVSPTLEAPSTQTNPAPTALTGQVSQQPLAAEQLVTANDQMHQQDNKDRLVQQTTSAESYTPDEQQATVELPEADAYATVTSETNEQASTSEESEPMEPTASETTPDDTLETESPPNEPQATEQKEGALQIPEKWSQIRDLQTAPCILTVDMPQELKPKDITAQAIEQARQDKLFSLHNDRELDSNESDNQEVNMAAINQNDNEDDDEQDYDEEDIPSDLNSGDLDEGLDSAGAL